MAQVGVNNEAVAVGPGQVVEPGDKEKVMADTLATLATLASLVNGDEKMDINSAMLKMEESGASRDIQHVELVVKDQVGGEKGVEVKEGGGSILEQVKDVEVVVSQPDAIPRRRYCTCMCLQADRKRRRRRT